MLSAKRKLLLNIKNLPGWSTKRKIVVFSVDDYGNVRIASKEARENLREAGLKINDNRFDQYDALEDANDLTHLYDTLTSVKDSRGKHAIFTAFAVPANIDFDAVKQSNYTQYHYELLPTTFNKLKCYEGVWDLWKEGMSKNLLVPQFHGREHLNLKFFNHLLQKKDPELVACIENNSFGAFSSKPFKTISYTAAFDFDQYEENEQHKKVIIDGLDAFEKVFGYRATHFNAPGAYEHHCLEKTMRDCGIKYIDTALIKNEHQGGGIYKKRFYTLGKRNSLEQYYIIRNCVFEPLLYPSMDCVDICLSEIEIAFRWNKPANISTHRVNFSGHIEPEIRERGLVELKRLLKTIVKRWPDVEFLSSVELGEEIRAISKKK